MKEGNTLRHNKRGSKMLVFFEKPLCRKKEKGIVWQVFYYIICKNFKKRVSNTERGTEKRSLKRGRVTKKN